MKASDFPYDSGEYEFLSEAVWLSKDVPGMCCEVGLRLGRGTAEIIQAVAENKLDKLVISIDPFGSIPYVGREHVGPIRLDYDNNMKAQCLSRLYPFAQENGVKYDHYPWTDSVFFKKMGDGVPYYDLHEHWVDTYSMIHLDGPHSVAAISAELDFFIPRMLPGSVIVYDDITPDFYPHEKIQEKYLSRGFEIVKTGFKKEVWVMKTQKYIKELSHIPVK